jgi:acyl-CoA dehydrogenase
VEDSVLWGLPACPPSAREWRARVAEFVATRVVPHEAELDVGGPAARLLIERLRDAARAAGLWGLPLPAELGGAGLPLLEYAHVAEAEGVSDHAPAVLGSTILLDVKVLAGDDGATTGGGRGLHAEVLAGGADGGAGARTRHGVDLELLRRVAAGRLSVCNAMTEPDTPGSDPTLITTRARREPDGSWTIHGRKWFVTGAGHADLALVLARTSGEAPARSGLSVLLVPTASPGFRVVRELPILGAGGQWEIALDGVTVPSDHLIGEEGGGLRVVGERVRLGRLLRCLRWLGQAERAFTLMRDRARTRETASGRLADLQLVQQLVFDALLAIRTTRPLVFEAVAAVAAGRSARLETGLAKVAAARMLQQVTDAAVQVHGAAGLGPDSALPALFRTGRLARVLDGPDELHVTTVAERLLR